MDLGIGGKNAFVCGSTAGIGLAVARELAAAGVNVVVTGRRGELAEAEAARIREDFGVQAIGLGMDLLDADSRATALAEAHSALGPIGIVLLNGPGPRPGGARSIRPEEVVQAAATLIEPHVSLVGQLLPEMQRRGWGRIVAIGASSMTRSNTWLTLSAVGRSGLARYLQALAKEIAASGVTVNIVQPGLVATERIDELDELEVAERGGTMAEARQRREESIPLKRLGEPAELGATVAFFCSQQAAYITGQLLLVDGGSGAAD